MERLEEEVSFWERFIREWPLNHDESVPWRAYQALMLARQRLEHALDGDPFYRCHGAAEPDTQ